MKGLSHSKMQVCVQTFLKCYSETLGQLAEYTGPVSDNLAIHL